MALPSGAGVGIAGSLREGVAWVLLSLLLLAATRASEPALSAVVTNTLDSGPGSLRAAILLAVDHPGTTITFAVPSTDPGLAEGVFTIAPSAVLPDLGTGTVIDGHSQMPATNPSGPSIALSGAGLAGLGPGLRLTAANCAVRGLIVSRFTGVGIEITGAAAIQNAVTGCYIGTDNTGLSARPNGTAIRVSNLASANTIGGSTSAERNVLSGNVGEGVLFLSGATGNLVVGNYLGLAADGTRALPNSFGVALHSSGNTIGAVGAGNVISGNTFTGVVIDGFSSSGNAVRANLIGLAANGSTTRGNGERGVWLAGSANNRIGGAGRGEGNVISGNALSGILMSDSGTSGNRVEGNLIGTDATGSSARPNTGPGVELSSGSTGNFVGGAAAGAGNTISGNARAGVSLGFGTSANQVLGNRIGLDRTGLVALPNAEDGVLVFSAARNNLIGGGFGTARNFIAGNLRHGVALAFEGTSGNQVLGNVIGANAADSAVPNGGSGVALAGGAQDNLIGGSAPGSGNVIRDNAAQGIVLTDAPTRGNTLRRNQIHGNAGAGIATVAGANDGQAPPSLTAASLGLGTTVQGTMAGGVGSTRLEFFATLVSESTGGAGRIFLGESTPTAANFSITLPATVPAGLTVTATATGASGSTSAFSNAVVVTAVDTLGGGIPDSWREVYFGPGWMTDPRVGAAADPDGDGQDNLAEFRAGTNPTLASDRFALPASRSSGEVVLSLSTVPGIEYQLESSSTLTDGWLPLASPIQGTGTVLQVTDPGSAALSQRFYRAVVVP